MNPSFVKEYIEEVCAQLDGRIDFARLRQLAVAAAVPMLVVSSGCPEPIVSLYGVPAYGVPYDAGLTSEDDCRDARDEDRDGLADCNDEDCRHLEVCLGCFDGVDNDADGRADCADQSCQPAEGCVGTCDDEEDNDSNGLTDCNDPVCAGSGDCL
jgi:hypothetical protein